MFEKEANVYISTYLNGVLNSCTVLAARTLEKTLQHTSIIACPESDCNNSSFGCIKIQMLYTTPTKR